MSDIKKRPAEEVWKSFDVPFDGPAAALADALINNQEELIALLGKWEKNCQVLGTKYVVGLYETTSERFAADDYSVAFYEWEAFRQVAKSFNLPDSSVEQASTHLRECVSNYLYFPPICVVWHDGKENNFVSEMMLLRLQNH